LSAARCPTGAFSIASCEFDDSIRTPASLAIFGHRHLRFRHACATASRLTDVAA
jgi:hypothetical protein